MVHSVAEHSRTAAAPDDTWTPENLDLFELHVFSPPIGSTDEVAAARRDMRRIVASLPPSVARQYADAHFGALFHHDLIVIDEGATPEWCTLVMDLWNLANPGRGVSPGSVCEALHALSDTRDVWASCRDTGLTGVDAERWVWAAVHHNDRQGRAYRTRTAIDGKIVMPYPPSGFTWKASLPRLVNAWADIPAATSWIVTGHAAPQAKHLLADCDTTRERAALIRRVLTLEALNPDPYGYQPRHIPTTETVMPSWSR